MLAVVGAFTIALLKQHGHDQRVPGGAEPSTRGVRGLSTSTRAQPNAARPDAGGGRKEKDPS